MMSQISQVITMQSTKKKKKPSAFIFTNDTHLIRWKFGCEPQCNNKQTDVPVLLALLQVNQLE